MNKETHMNTSHLSKLTDAELNSAIEAYLAYSKGEPPRGETDNARRWYPIRQERQACCEQIRDPSRAYPWSLWKHCQSLAHKEHLFKARHADVLALKKWISTTTIDVEKCDASAIIAELRRTKSTSVKH